MCTSTICYLLSFASVDSNITDYRCLDLGASTMILNVKFEQKVANYSFLTCESTQNGQTENCKTAPQSRRQSVDCPRRAERVGAGRGRKEEEEVGA
jgi:hypothetical protein